VIPYSRRRIRPQEADRGAIDGQNTQSPPGTPPSGLEDPRGDADDPYPEAREFAGQRQGQAHHPALGGGIGDLPDLSIEGGDGGRIDDDATFPIRFRIVALHGGGRGAAYREGAD